MDDEGFPLGIYTLRYEGQPPTHHLTMPLSDQEWLDVVLCATERGIGVVELLRNAVLSDLVR